MKIGMIAVLLGLFAPMNVFAQDVEDTVSELAAQVEESKGKQEIIITEYQKLEFITDVVHQMKTGGKPLSEIEATEFTESTESAEVTDEQVGPEYIEALIHSEGPDAIRKYHMSVRAMMKNNVEWTKYDSMLLTIHEIEMLVSHMDWRAMRAHLSSLERYSANNFPMWTKMRVESWLAQAETMAAIRPEDLAKSRDIEALIAKVRLAQKLNEDLEYDYVLADRVLELEKSRTPEALALAEEGNKPFYKRWAKKLKFW